MNPYERGENKKENNDSRIVAQDPDGDDNDDDNYQHHLHNYQNTYSASEVHNTH